MKKLLFFFFMIIITLVLFSQTKANVKMLNGDSIPCEIETEQLDLVTDYGELSFGTKFIKTIQFPEPGKGNTVLITIFGETFRGFITNDIIKLNVYGSQMQIRKAKINNIEFLNENQQATDYTIVISLRNGDAFYATPADSIINIQTSYGEVKLPFENMVEISFEGFGNVLTRIEMKDGGIMQGIIKDDYIPVNLLSEIELEVVPDLMKEIAFGNPEEKKQNLQTDTGKRQTLNNTTMEKEETTGSVYINTSPSEAYIFIDGSYKGKSPVEIVELKAGYYILKIKKESYEDINESIKIEAGKRETQTFTLYSAEYQPSANVPEQVLVKTGEFQMGDESENKYSWARPVHTVKLTYDYYIGKYEITFNEYDAYCEAAGKNKPDNEGWGSGERPVINVNWYDAIEYCNWLSDKEGLQKAYDSNGYLLDKDGNRTIDITEVEGYRLPTEAEWEYAAKGGHKKKEDYIYAGSNDINEVAWYEDNSYSMTQKVGQKKPNELGFFDMSGNVWEWCYDWFGNYPSTTQINPIGPEYGSFRVKRGGSWRSQKRLEECWVTNRQVVTQAFSYPKNNYEFNGFRIARTR